MFNLLSNNSVQILKTCVGMAMPSTENNWLRMPMTMILLVVILIITVFGFQQLMNDDQKNYFSSIPIQYLHVYDTHTPLVQWMKNTNSKWDTSEGAYSESRRSLMSYKNELGCYGGLIGTELINDAIAGTEMFNHNSTDNSTTLKKFFVDMTRSQLQVAPSPQSVCSCIDHLSYFSYFSEDASDPPVSTVDPKIRTLLNTVMTKLQADHPNSDVLKYMTRGDKKNDAIGLGYAGEAFTHIVADTTWANYCPDKEKEFMMFKLCTKDEACEEQTEKCCKDKSAKCTNTNDLKKEKNRIAFVECMDKIVAKSEPATKWADELQSKEHFAFKCRAIRDTEILQVCGRRAIPISYMETSRYINATAEIWNGIICMLLYVLYMTLRAQLDRLYSTTVMDRNKSSWFIKWQYVLTLVLILLVIIQQGFWYAHGDWNHPTGPSDASFWNNILFGSVQLLFVIIVIIYCVGYVYFQMNVFTYTHEEGVAVNFKGLETNWKLSVLIFSQMIIDVHLIIGFVCLAKGLLLQMGVNDTYTVATAQGIFLVIGLIAHISNVIKHIQYRCTMRPEMQSIDFQIVRNIEQAALSARILVAFFVLLGGYSAWMLCKVESASTGYLFSFNSMQYLYLCLAFVLINVGIDFWQELRAMIKIKFRSSKETDDAQDMNFAIYSDGSSFKAAVVCIYVFTLVLMRYYVVTSHKERSEIINPVGS